MRYLFNFFKNEGEIEDDRVIFDEEYREMVGKN